MGQEGEWIQHMISSKLQVTSWLITSKDDLFVFKSVALEPQKIPNKDDRRIIRTVTIHAYYIHILDTLYIGNPSNACAGEATTSILNPCRRSMVSSTLGYRYTRGLHNAFAEHAIVSIPIREHDILQTIRTI